MHIVIACDSFKGSLTTLAAAAAIRTGLLRVAPDAAITAIPIADGGEGTVAAMVAGLGGCLHPVPVHGPLGKPVSAPIGDLGTGTAVIEMASASGLPLIAPGERNPVKATTFGTGELLLAALKGGFKKIYIGIGGSATNDGGLGFAQALGARFYDETGTLIPPGEGSILQPIAHVDLTGLSPLLFQAKIIAICDVDNPLCGEIGASRIFGPQKGVKAEDIPLFDAGLARLARAAGKAGALADLPGAGAAGGLGFGLMAFAGAKLHAGIEVMLDVAGFDALAQTASLIVTGEGRVDGQSIHGKVPVGVARRAKKINPGLPVAAVAGSLGTGAELVFAHGIDCLESAVNAPMSLETAMAQAAALTADAAERLLRAMSAGARLLSVSY